MIRLTCGNGKIEVMRPRRLSQQPRGAENTCLRGALMAQRTCDVPGCGRTRYCKGYCSAHYQRWKKSGDAGPAEVMPMSVAKGPRRCSVDGCDRPYLARGYCSPHWQRWQKSGDPGPAEVRRQDARCSVSACDRPHYGNGYCNAHWRRWRRTGDPGQAEIKTQRQKCSVSGCEDPHSAQGYCSSHYARWRRTGSAGAPFSVRRRDPRVRDEQGRKQCRDCDRWLPESSFHKNRAQSDGLSPRCEQCHYAKAVARRYGLEPSWYFDTLSRQGGGCAICGTPPNGKRLHVDHDHSHCTANKGCPICVRGLLCSPCNTGIGMLGESVERLGLAVSYLKSWQ